MKEFTSEVTLSQDIGVSIIMAVYNADAFLECAVDSILTQTFRDFELIIINDCSTDKSLEILTAFKKQDDRIVLINNAENKGLTVNLNTALKFAKYNYIMRMDADDISLPDRIQSQLNFLLNNPTVDVVGGAIIEINSCGKETGKVIHYPQEHAACYNFFKKRDPLAHPAVMFRRRFFEKAGMYNEAYRTNQDTHLWMQGFVNSCIFSNLQQPVLKFRVSDEFFSKRRHGYERAQMLLKLKKHACTELGYGVKGLLFAYALFMITIMPMPVKRLAYRIFR